MCQVLFPDPLTVDIHTVLAKYVIAHLQFSLFRRNVGNITAFRVNAPLLQHHHHSDKAGQLKRFRLGNIADRISHDHVSKGMLTKGDADDRFGFQSLICFIFLRIALPYGLCVRDDHRFLADQVLSPCDEFFRHLKLMKKGLFHRSSLHVIPHFRTP